MKSIVLRDYQQRTYDNIMVALAKHRKIAVQLATGGGKSVVIGKLAQGLRGRTLVLTHRIEILNQNAEWIEDAGILTADTKEPPTNKRVVFAMVQTAHARIEKYGIEYMGEFRNVILDEIQVQIFEKVFSRYKPYNLIGFTATPVLSQTETKYIDEVKFTRPKTLACMFDAIVCGADSQELIDLGFLTQEHNIVLKLPEMDKLVDSQSSPDGYTMDSLNAVYSNEASIQILLDGYDEYCKGKKTIIFNASTKINEHVCEAFKSMGANVKMFDSVNTAEENPATGKPFTRDEIIEWFRNERDAILINTNVFTTGFNVTDVECVILNRATKSLSLFIQMVGRGSRITDKIYKPSFTVLDLGQNVYTHGAWSADRDWNEQFREKDWKRANPGDMMQTWTCHECGAYNLVGDTKCSDCGAEKLTVKIENTKKLKTGEFVEVGKMPLPKAKAIISYTKSIGEGSTFAFNLLEKRIIDLFKNNNVTPEFYHKRRRDFHKRMNDIYRPVYFGIIHSNLQGVNARLQTRVNRLIKKVDKIYGEET